MISNKTFNLCNRGTILEIITSIKNDLVKKIRDIRDNSKDKLFLDNPKTIVEALKNGEKLENLLINCKKEKEIVQKYPIFCDLNYTLVGENVIDNLSATKTPQGVVAVFDFQGKNINLHDNFICLDTLQDPGNLGTILRSASGTSFKNIFLINCVNYLSPKVVRSSMGGILKLNFKTFDSTTEFVNFARENGLKYVVADMSGENVFRSKLDFSPLGVVVGSEGQGVDKLLRENAEKLVSIPMKNGLESLNAGVSCSIIIYSIENNR